MLMNLKVKKVQILMDKQRFKLTSRVNTCKKLSILALVLIITACGTKWKVQSVTNQEYIVDDIVIKDSEEDQLLILDGRSEIMLSLDGVKRIVFNHDHSKQYKGKSWILVRVDFEDEEKKSFNVPTDSSFVVGDREIYMQNSTWFQGQMGESKGEWAAFDIKEIVLEEEPLLSMDSTKQVSSTLGVQKTEADVAVKPETDATPATPETPVVTPPEAVE